MISNQRVNTKDTGMCQRWRAYRKSVRGSNHYIEFFTGIFLNCNVVLCSRKYILYILAEWWWEPSPQWMLLFQWPMVKIQLEFWRCTCNWVDKQPFCDAFLLVQTCFFMIRTIILCVGYADTILVSLGFKVDIREFCGSRTWPNNVNLALGINILFKVSRHVCEHCSFWEDVWA